VEGRDAFHASGLTDLIGREEELDLLLRRWSKAKIGEGQVVLLSGEAGIGKSGWRLREVGHHGSHNATLKEHGVEEMDGLKIGIIPVDEKQALKKRWGRMPLPDLIAALDAKLAVSTPPGSFRNRV
jgi:hypothetical protein